MIAVVPGPKFFNHTLETVYNRLRSINEWMEENDMADRVISYGNTATDYTLRFMFEEDAVAFKLRFGV